MNKIGRLLLVWVVGALCLLGFSSGPAAAAEVREAPERQESLEQETPEVRAAGHGDPAVWDVLVVGAEPEGIAAAVAAARAGAEVALVDGRERLGGLYTLGALNMLDLNFKYPGSDEIIHTGFFAEFHEAMGGRAAFDTGRAERWFGEVLDEAGVRVFLGHRLVRPLKSGSVVNGILAEGPDGERREFRARRVIDATADADVAAAAGARCRTGRAELRMPEVTAAATLVFGLEGVDWTQVCRYLRDEDGDPATGFADGAAWGYGHLLNYPSRDPRLRMRGLNLGLQEDGTVAVNALQVFGVDPLDPESRRKGLERALAELPEIVLYMRRKCPGFLNARLAWTAEELYIRESRRIVGLETLTGDDIFENRFPWNTIALGSYPVDLQAARPGERGAALNGTNPYGIPFGALVPAGLDGLLVVGKAASFDIVAHGSARTVPVGMSTGQAAGVAAAYSVETGKSFRRINGDRRAVARIRELLAEQGVDLTPVELDRPEREHWSYPYVQWLRGRALLSLGYGNAYGLDEPASLPVVAEGVLALANCHANLGYDLERLRSYPAPGTLADWERLAAEILRKPVRTLEELHRDGVLSAEV